ncbi:prolipoprotein diacylglyceryl transferase [Bacillaceae bacterium Marseille-Q3522]|nr:prolipoprotein diacylglyceryl transferase [Bacillaceae bacterium Marseille-Q3522]
MEETIHVLNPIALELGPIRVYWYGVIIGVGIALALWLAMREGNRRGLPKELFPDLLLWAIPIAIISARIYYVIFQWDYYADNPVDIVKIWEGGIAIHGALIGAIITAYVFTKKRQIPFWKVLDIAAPSIILGQVIGRWGNFMNQEAYGEEVSRQFLENLFLPDFIINQMYIEGAYHHPTFLYESVWNLIGFVILLLLRKVNLRRGEIFLSYVIWYSIGRFYIEGMRTDSLMLDSLRMAQMVSIAAVVVSIVFIVYRRVKSNDKTRYLER